MLVSYFNEELNDVVVEHLGSLEVANVRSASLERLMCDFFQHSLVEPNQHARLMQRDAQEQIRAGDKDSREALSHSA